MKKSLKDIQKIVREFTIQPTSEMRSKVLDEALELQQHRNRPSTPDTNTWRIIMKSNITKFAAAIIIIVALTVIYQFTGSINGASVAWAEVAKKVETIQSYVCRQKSLQKTADTCQPEEMNMKIYTSLEYGSRIDNYQDGDVISSTYTLPPEKVIITVIPGTETYFRHPMTDEMIKEMRQTGPTEMVREFFSVDYKKIGQKTINGLVTEGIEVNNPSVVNANFPVGKVIARLWVDPKTNLPVLLEAEISDLAGDLYMKTVIDQFEWNLKLEKSIFDPYIPEDHTKPNIQNEITGSEKKVLSEKEQMEKAKINEMTRDVFQSLTKEELESFLKFLPYEIITPQIKDYEYLSGLKVIDIKEPYREIGSSKWIVPYKVELKSGSIREGNLYIGYYEKSKRYVITGGLRE